MWTPVIEQTHLAVRVRGCSSFSSARVNLEVHVGGNRRVDFVSLKANGHAEDTQEQMPESDPKPKLQVSQLPQRPVWSAESLGTMKATMSKQLILVQETMSKQLTKVRDQVSDGLTKVRDQVSDGLEKVKEQVADQLEKVKETVRLKLNVIGQSIIRERAENAVSSGVMVTLSLATLEQAAHILRRFGQVLGPSTGEDTAALHAFGSGRDTCEATQKSLSSGFIVELRTNDTPGCDAMRVAVSCGCGAEEQAFAPNQRRTNIRCECVTAQVRKCAKPQLIL